MPEKKSLVRDFALTVFTLFAAFLINLVLQNQYQTQTMTPMIFVLGVFLVSLRTEGYFWGIVDSVASVLAVNYAFTYPYYAFDLITPECLSSAVVMLIVSTMTSALTTQIKAQEKLKVEAERERMRGNLLRAVSHDLRTPLTAIYGSCTALLEEYDAISEVQRQKLLTDMRSDAQWLVRMVENLLSVTRIDNNKVRLAKNDTVLEELVDAVLVKFRKRYPDQIVQVQIPEDFLSIPMDAMLIEQVLLNLLENAVAHAVGMENLKLTVEQKGSRVEFHVLDDGCGIPNEKLPRLFTGVADSRRSPDTGRSNMGIGLSVCATIIKAHGGEIHVRNRDGGGAEFWFALDKEERGK